MRAEFPVIAIGASAGALDAVRHITEALLRNCAAAVVLVFHVGTMRSQLPEILSWHGKMPVRFAEDGASLEPGPGRIRLDRGLRVGLALIHTKEAAVAEMPAAAAVATANAEVLKIEMLARRVTKFCAKGAGRSSPATERVARRVVADVARASSARPMAWIRLHDIVRRLGINQDSGTSALRLAVDRGWLIMMGLSPHSVCQLTDAGRALPRPVPKA